MTLAVSILTASAASFTSDFGNPAQTGFTLNGGTRPDGVNPYPVIENGHLVLTYNENGQQGSFVLDDLDGGSAIESFTAAFKLQIGPGSGNAADGFSFSFGPEITSTTNTGEEGAGNFINVCFDIYDNGGNEAPAIDIKFGGAVIAHAAFTKADLVTSNLEDVKIELTRAGVLSVLLKGQYIHKNVILPAFAPSQGQFVFAARTGGENANQWLDDVSVKTTKAGAAVTPTITSVPNSVTINERGNTSFSVEFDGTAPMKFRWLKNGSEITGATGASLSLTRVPFSDNNAKIQCEISNASGKVTSQEAILTVTADTVKPTLAQVEGAGDFTHVRLAFSEPVDKASSEKLANYTIEGLSISAAVRSDAPNDHVVVLTTAKQAEGKEYTLTVKDIADTATGANLVATGTQAKFTSFALVGGGLKIELFLDITGSAVQALLDAEKYINNQPDKTGYVTQFSSRDLLTDSLTENYGGRLSGWIVPAVTGQYEFFIRSDDSSQLWLSTDDKPLNAQMIAEEIGCCGPFEEPGAPETSAPQDLVAGKKYAIYALWKDGGGGDYCDVTWRKLPDATSPRSLAYIPGSVLATYAQPTTFVSPTIAITSPADGATFETNALVNLTALVTPASGKAILRVDFLELGKVIGSATSSPFSISLSGLSEGPHKFIARAVDSSGISADSGAITVNVGKQSLEVVLSQIDDQTVWKYNRAGVDLGTVWRDKGFDDSAWPSGKMLIADETTTTVEPIRTPITRFNDASEYVKTFYFRRKVNFDFVPDAGVKLQLRHAVDDGVVVYVNGKEVHRLGITADPVEHSSDAAGHENAWEGPYLIPGTVLVKGENIISAEVHQSGGSSSDMVFGLELKAFVPLVPKQLDVVKIDDKTSWKYDRSGQNLGTEWRQKTFNDTAWPSGKALIADETTTTVEPIRTPISRFNDASEYVKTFYFRTSFILPITSTAGAKLKLRHALDDGAIFYLNGTEIHRFGITADPVDYLSDAAGHENAYEGPFDIPITALLLGENVLAAEVHQSGGSSSDMVFGAELSAIVMAQDLGGSAPTPTISIKGGNAPTITFTGTLQRATTLSGTYSDVAGATSPYTVPVDETANFYRTRQ